MRSGRLRCIYDASRFLCSPSSPARTHTLRSCRSVVDCLRGGTVLVVFSSWCVTYHFFPSPLGTQDLFFSPHLHSSAPTSSLEVFFYFLFCCCSPFSLCSVFLLLFILCIYTTVYIRFVSFPIWCHVEKTKAASPLSTPPFWGHFFSLLHG